MYTVHNIPILLSFLLLRLLLWVWGASILKGCRLTYTGLVQQIQTHARNFAWVIHNKRGLAPSALLVSAATSLQARPAAGSSTRLNLSVSINDCRGFAGS